MIQYKNILLAGFIFLSGLINAQLKDSIKVVGRIIADSGSSVITDRTKVYLNPINPDDDYFMATVDAQGNFSMKVPVNAATLYVMKYRDYKMDVLLCPSETVFNVEIKADNRTIKNMKVVGSREYEAFRTFKKINNAFKEKLPGLIADYRRQSPEAAARFKKEINDFNGLLEYLRISHKNTYAAEYLVPMAEMPELNNGKQLLLQLPEHFFDGARFADTMLYRTFELSNQISAYVENVADTGANARLAFITTVIANAQGNRTAQKQLLFTLMNNFADARRENFLESLVKWAHSKPKLSDEQPVMAAKLDLIAKTIPGAKAPEVEGQDLSGEQQLLTAFVKKHKLSMLLFWSSDCPHCKKEMPDVQKLYEKYHEKGFDIFAASIEPHKEKWKQYVEANKQPWLQTIIAAESPAHADYYIQYTPTFVLIDTSGIIIHRFISIGDLDAMVGDILGK